MKSFSQILTEAHELINGPRQQAYDHPFNDYGKVARIFHAMTGVNLSTKQAVLFMVAVKLARLTTNIDEGRWHRDSIVDAAGYLGCEPCGCNRGNSGWRQVCFLIKQTRICNMEVCGHRP